MSEQIKPFVDSVLGAETEEAAIATYMDAPKAVRRSAYNQIREKDAKLGAKIREAAEARRGIAFRTIAGDVIMDKEAMKEQVLRLVQKEKQMQERKETLGDRVVELKSQAQKFYGDEFLTELEDVIAQS